MKNLLILIGGIAIGAGASWVYHKNKYEQMVQEEIESLREHMQSKCGVGGMKSANNVDAEIEPLTNEEDDEINYPKSLEKAKNIINYNKYSSHSDDEQKDEEIKPPYIVTPEDFASLPGYDTDTFYYHYDDIIADENAEMVDDVELTFGMTVLEIRDQFGVYEEDSVYIRNERLKTDYEILRDNDEYVRRNGD